MTDFMQFLEFPSKNLNLISNRWKLLLLSFSYLLAESLKLDGHNFLVNLSGYLLDLFDVYPFLFPVFNLLDLKP